MSVSVDAMIITLPPPLPLITPQSRADHITTHKRLVSAPGTHTHRQHNAATQTPISRIQTEGGLHIERAYISPSFHQQQCELLQTRTEQPEYEQYRQQQEQQDQQELHYQQYQQAQQRVWTPVSKHPRLSPSLSTPGPISLSVQTESFSHRSCSCQLDNREGGSERCSYIQEEECEARQTFYPPPRVSTHWCRTEANSAMCSSGPSSGVSNGFSPSDYQARSVPVTMKRTRIDTLSAHVNPFKSPTEYSQHLAQQKHNQAYQQQPQQQTSFNQAPEHTDLFHHQYPFTPRRLVYALSSPVPAHPITSRADRVETHDTIHSILFIRRENKTQNNNNSDNNMALNETASSKRMQQEEKDQLEEICTGSQLLTGDMDHSMNRVTSVTRSTQRDNSSHSDSSQMRTHSLSQSQSSTCTRISPSPSLSPSPSPCSSASTSFSFPSLSSSLNSLGSQSFNALFSTLDMHTAPPPTQLSPINMSCRISSNNTNGNNTNGNNTNGNNSSNNYTTSGSSPFFDSSLFGSAVTHQRDSVISKGVHVFTDQLNTLKQMRRSNSNSNSNNNTPAQTYSTLNQTQ